MGIRFEGPTIEHAKGADIISDGIGPAPSRCRAPACRSGPGRPPTVGGYPK